ncbi:amidase, putative [Cordyceps militaris CM01]|uniref:Amidase, putative n=1 Tax=Cordyceps militaris (strain CM01) TaxID=983644 RepID=G3JAJ4_CORMM|nr:amidase, putative [Cordyceps militaris CM01]EGX94310.1 amidase, putative [Cordyceps militaris CM01]
MAYIETDTTASYLSFLSYLRFRPMDQNLYQLSATALQAKLTAGEITSVDLVESCLARIERYNSRLNCLLSIRPRTQLFAHAAALDAERRARPSATRSKLHGIPIILKDAIVTGPELDLLQEAGMIILGKSNMTEFCGLKSNFIKSGWSTCGGQTNSPYRKRNFSEADQPITAGSSSGSAVAVAAGFAPLSIGTETSAALVYPASVCGVYAYKCGHNSVPMEGVFSISESYDCVGPIARDPKDIVALAEILQQNSRFSMVIASSAGDAGQEFRGFAVGVVASTWGVHESLVAAKWGDAQVIKEYENAVAKMRGRGARVVYPLQAPESDSIRYDGENLISTSYGEFSGRVKEFLRCFEFAGIKDLKDIIAWNDAHADTALRPPYDTQTELIAAVNSKMQPEMLRNIVPRLRHLAGNNGMSEVMRRSGDLDIVLSSSECQLVTYAATAGWPCATVPLGNWRKNGQPYGMFALSKDGEEETLLGFVSAWGKVFEGVQGPDLEMMPKESARGRRESTSGSLP